MEADLDKALSSKRFNYSDQGRHGVTREDIYQKAIACNKNLDQIDEVMKEIAKTVNKGASP
jgi:hypothetical protein